jgi:MoaA/NifB/PqqE/SkfB family radical SAM enzyme
MLVRIRRDNERYFAYFLDSRRLVETNEVGAGILDLVLNKDMGRGEAAVALAQEYGIAPSDARADVDRFLAAVAEKLTSRDGSGPDQGQLAVPLAAELQITQACNLRCAHCFQQEYTEQYMSPQRACAIVDTLTAAGVCEINLIGGEPLKHPGLFEILGHCETCQCATSLTTNGTLLGEATLNRLARFERLHVLVSLDGVNGIHDALRGKGTFGETAKAILGLKSRRVSVDVLCTLNSLNLPHLPEIVGYCRALGVAVSFNLFKPFKAGHAHLIPVPEAFFDAIVRLHEMRQKGEAVALFNAAIASELMGLPSRNECTANMSGLVIDSMGRMVPCPGLVDAGYQNAKELPMFTKDFLGTWKSHPVFVRFRENGLSGCQVRSFIFCRDVQVPDPYSLPAFRNYLASRQTTAPVVGRRNGY